MSQEMQKPISTEERLLAAIAHAAIVLQGVSLLVGVLVYITQREKARFAAFHGLQAAVYQLITMILTVGLWLVWGIFYAFSMIPLVQLAETMPNAPPPPIFWVGMGTMAIPILAMVVFGLYALWAALRAWQGKDFRYALIGGWLERSGLWNSGAK